MIADAPGPGDFDLDIRRLEGGIAEPGHSTTDVEACPGGRVAEADAAAFIVRRNRVVSRAPATKPHLCKGR